MALLDRLFRRGGASSSEDVEQSTPEVIVCDICNCEVDEDELEEGQCADCYDSEYTGPRYCCGMIYEEGEELCASCGEWI